MNQGELLLSARHLSKVRTAGDAGFEIRIPRFDLGAGDRVALIGPSGSGKSTVIAMIALAMAPEPEGQLLIRDRSNGTILDANLLWSRNDDETLTRLRRETFGYVQQVGGLLPFMTVGQNLTLTQEISGSGTPEAAFDLARRIGISEFLDRYPGTLSVGQRQRAGIVQALAHCPQIIVADEPTAALDRSTAASVMSLLVEQANLRGVALLLATHDVALSDHFGFDRVPAKQFAPGVNVFQRRRLPAGREPSPSRHAAARKMRVSPGTRPGTSLETSPGAIPGGQPWRASMIRGRRVRLAAVFAWRDLRYETTNFACQVLAIAAVVAPLLVLYGLKSGVVEHLTDQLGSDIRTLQISIVNERSFTDDWIGQMADQPDVGFIQAHTRSLAANVEIVARRQGAMASQRSTLLASGDRDPLLPDSVTPPGAGTIVLSSSTSRALGVSVGDEVELLVSRHLDDRVSSVFLPLRVAGVVEPSRWDAHGALVGLQTLVDVERWRDGNAVPERGWMTGRTEAAQRASYPNIRLYASSLDAVEPLVIRLQDEGLDVRSRLADVQAIQGLDRSLTAIFLIIGSVAVSGAAVAFGATLWANVLRKTRSISLFRLQGMERSAVAVFPGVQALIIAGAGLLLASGFAVGTCTVIDGFFGAGLPGDARLCRVSGEHIGVSAIIAFTIALAASIAAVRVIFRTDPARGLSID